MSQVISSSLCSFFVTAYHQNGIAAPDLPVSVAQRRVLSSESEGSRFKFKKDQFFMCKACSSDSLLFITLLSCSQLNCLQC